MKVLVFDRKLALDDVRKGCINPNITDIEIESIEYSIFPTYGHLFDHLSSFMVYGGLGSEYIEFNDYSVPFSWYVEVEIPSCSGRVTDIRDLAYNQPYYYIDDRGNIWDTVANLNFEDSERISVGNAFFDEDSAYDESKCRKVYNIVSKYAYRFSNEDWCSMGVDKFIPYYSHAFKKVCIRSEYYENTRSLYFKSKEDIQKAIDEVGEEDFIKYYLTIEI